VQFRFDQSLYLYVALLAVPTAIIGYRTLRGMSASRRFVSIAARVLLLCLLAVILAGPNTIRYTRTLAVIAVVDTSGSVRRYLGNGPISAIERAKQFIAKATQNRGEEDLVGVIIFDGKSVSIAQPTRADITQREWDVRMSDGTNIADALRMARSIIPPQASARIVLFSDGNETQGSALDAAAEISAPSADKSMVRAPVDVVPLTYRVRNEVAIEQVDAPPAAQANSTISIRALLSATAATTGYLRLYMDDAPVQLDPRSPDSAKFVRLNAGTNVERMEVKLDDKRVHRFRAVFEPESAPPANDPNGVPAPIGDTVLENNSGEAFTLAPGKGAVLLADGVGEGVEDGPGATLAHSLRAAGFNVKLVPGDGLPRDLIALQEYDLIILQNVAADSIDENVQTALAAYVQDMGGGLVMVGGPNSFGAGGWRGSRLEPILPVRLDLPERLITSEVAIEFVLDNSGSMWRYVFGSDKTQQEIANDATALAIRSLDKRDKVGVITFNSRKDELVPLGPNSDPAKTMEIVRGIMSGGGTIAPPAIELARKRLNEVKAKHKHMVVLSDGRSLDAELLPGLCEQIAGEGITVSTIAVGDDADGATMAEMAKRGGGTYYRVSNATNLPQVFLKAVRIVRTPLIREEPFTPLVLASGSAITMGLPEAPPLLGLALTQPRIDPLVVNAMLTDKGEPVLAHWQAGLGQVVAFTSDAHRWAESWIGKPIYSQLWTQIVRAASRPTSSGQGVVATLQPADGSLRVRLVATGADASPRDGLNARVTVYGPGGKDPVEIGLFPTGPGVYEATVAAENAGSYVAIIKPYEGAKPLPPVVAGASINEGKEFRFSQSNDALLREIAQRTGGRVLDLALPEKAALFDRTGITARESVLPLRDELLWILLGLVLFDIASRRVAWDRWFSKLFAAAHSAARSSTSAEAVASMSTLRAVAERVGEAQAAVPSIALGEEEAKRLAMEARDRRRAAKFAAPSPQAAGSPSPAVSGDIAADRARAAQASVVMGDAKDGAAKTDAPESGLLAAKRRAADRFREEA